MRSYLDGVKTKFMQAGSLRKRNKPVTLANIGKTSMGIIATNMVEVVERTRGSGEGAITDLREAKIIELCTGPGGSVWVNVDGICALRIQHAETVFVDTTNALNTDKVLK